MPEIIAGALIAFLAIVGAAELLFKLKKQLLMPNVKHTAIVVACEGHDEEIEYSLRTLQNEADELKTGGSRMVVIVDNGMDDETLKICEKFKETNNGIEVCKVSDLPDVFNRELQI